ncbi:MAG: GNAT family N-acetyltransferase [Anaerolineae bacterium]|nr:GNAT family N-acetyltransferase [Anaerolineae bacterium]NUQ05585.1 GNAT family N-acetyltransferase [Anaerolineae bacterium]
MQMIRALYDREQRLDSRDPGVRLISTPHTVRLIDDSLGWGVILHSNLTETNADDIIAAEIDYFRTQTTVTDLEWKCYDYDAPADLLARLERQGFVPERPADAICVLDLAALPEKLRQPPAHDIRRITDPAGISDVLVVHAAVWGEDDAWIAEGRMRRRLENALRDSPETIRIYVAYVEGVPASACWMDLHEGGAFAGLWGGSTLEECRGRGLYTGLLAVRAQEAIRHDIRYLTIDASPMSRPIVEKLGFRFMADAYECNMTFTR